MNKQNFDWVSTYLKVARVSGGIEAECLCPFHEDSRPSFYVNLDTGNWICHGCRASGHGLVSLSRRMGAEYSEIQSLRKVDLSSEWWRSVVVEDPKPAPLPLDFKPGYEHWDRRMVIPETVTIWKLGYSRLLSSLIIPIYHEDEYRGFIRRRLPRDGEKVSVKYLEPKGYKKSMYLFGYTMARARALTQHGPVLVVEGVIDAILGWQYGYPTVATAGGPLTHNHVGYLRQLCPTTILLGFDMDRAGQEFYEKSLDVLKGVGAFHRRVEWSGKDLGDSPKASAIASIEEAYKSLILR